MVIFTSTIYGYINRGKPNGLDITVKSGDKFFAPTWAMVSDYKNSADKVLAWQRYEPLYRELMREQYRKNPGKFMELIDQQKYPFLVLCCYCRPFEECHRKLLAQILVDLGASKGISVYYKGEV